ncbi:MAG: alcohol dehydrogenase catalytic domain-containing protein [Oscillospiraceae bacterium]|nr:alcohol dehydrogenase catalytic domain-containing protein [Oscillospiraceae bacterium]
MNKTNKMLKATLVAPEKIIIEETDIPKPRENQILIKIERIGVCGSDPTIYFGKHPYVSYPVVMGHEFAGTVAALGNGVKSPAVGTRVSVIPHLVCGECEACGNEIYNFCESLRCTGAEADGAHCEYIAMPKEMVLPIPDSMSMDDAAMVEPACVAYHAAKRGEIKPDDIVLIIGAGPIGNFCMQSCKALGAKKVYVADLDSERLEIALALGADGVIDVSKESLDNIIEKPDVFFDCVGEKGRVLNDILKMAKRGTRVVMVGVLQNEYDIPLLPDFVQHELRLSGTTMYTPTDYREMIELMSAGKIRTQGMITHYFDLSQIIEVFNMIAKREIKFFKMIFKV